MCSKNKLPCQGKKIVFLNFYLKNMEILIYSVINILTSNVSESFILSTVAKICCYQLYPLDLLISTIQI